MITSTGLPQLAGQHDVGSQQRSRAWPTKALQLRPAQQIPLASSFSFNSYQDILCDQELNFQARQAPSQSTFSAPDVKRSLLGEPRPPGWSTFAAGQPPAKFRVHSRHHSVSRLNEIVRRPVVNGAVAASGCATTAGSDLRSLAHSRREEPQVSAGGPNSVPHQKQQVSLNSHIKFTQERTAPNLQSTHSDTNRPAATKQATMSSGTMQSIQSLSMQLNQAKARGSHSDLNAADSGLEEPSLQQGAQGNVSSAGKLSKLVGKKASRVKELVLQNLGKADRTADELFEMYEQNFHKQQAQALRLQKEFKNYVISMKGVHEAGKSLNGCIQQSTGDYQSARHDLVCENLSQLEHLNDDLLDKLRGQILVNLTEYLSQFNELRDKIAKRKRKLIDFDSSRRIYELQLVAVNKKRLQLQRAQQQPAGQAAQTAGARSALRSAFMLGGASSGVRRSSDSLQTATSQLVDEARLLKLREQYNYCKVMYETINSELHEELPMVYEKKMKHLLMSLQSYFSMEAQFHSNASKLFATAGDVIDELPMSVLQAAATHLHSNNRHQQAVRRNSSSLSLTAAEGKLVQAEVGPGFIKPTSAGSSGMGSSRGESSLDSSSSPDEEASSPTESSENRHSPSDDNQDMPAVEQDPGDDLEEAQIASLASQIQPGIRSDQDSGEQSTKVETDESTGPGSIVQEGPAAIDCVTTAAPQAQTGNTDVEASDEQLEGIASDQAELGVKKEDVFLYKVKTSYKYLAEDVDELCFEADEILQVVEFEPTHEQEEGWLMGVREVNGQRGLFPANFTQPI